MCYLQQGLKNYFAKNKTFRRSDFDKLFIDLFQTVIYIEPCKSYLNLKNIILN